jgi:DNA-binding winged helix-turn-helix (wHTH) protein
MSGNDRNMVPPEASSDFPVRWEREKVFSFDSFQLFPRKFLLLKTDKPIRIGSRSFEILVALLERPGELVSKQALMARMRPNALVEEANLTVQVTNLRRALGDGRDGNRLLINITARGYRFVGPVAIGA